MVAALDSSSSSSSSSRSGGRSENLDSMSQGRTVFARLLLRPLTAASGGPTPLGPAPSAPPPRGSSPISAPPSPPLLSSSRADLRTSFHERKVLRRWVLAVS